MLGRYLPNIWAGAPRLWKGFGGDCQSLGLSIGFLGGRGREDEDWVKQCWEGGEEKQGDDWGHRDR